MSIGQGAVAVLCGQEGNRRSGDALVMRHRLCDTHLLAQLNGLRKAVVTEYLAYTL